MFIFLLAQAPNVVSTGIAENEIDYGSVSCRDERLWCFQPSLLQCAKPKKCLPPPCSILWDCYLSRRKLIIMHNLGIIALTGGPYFRKDLSSEWVRIFNSSYYHSRWIPSPPPIYFEVSDHKTVAFGCW